MRAANTLKGGERRVFMAGIVRELGRGGQSRAEKELGWNRNTIIKGTHELRAGITCIDNFSARGRKPIEHRLPHLRRDIKEIAEAHSQTDATFKTDRLYTRLSAAAVRRQLVERKGYTDSELPSEETIRKKLNAMGFYLRAVEKSRPQKKGARNGRHL
jgi:hypothetical protein